MVDTHGQAGCSRLQTSGKGVGSLSLVAGCQEQLGGLLME